MKKNNKIVPFNYGALEVRTVMLDGEPWFVAKDVALALGYAWKGVSGTISHVPNQWRGVCTIKTPSGMQSMTTLSEAGLFFFLNRSDKPLAIPMQMWVAGEVLPTIRKTGGVYMTDQKAEELLADPDLIIGLAMQVKAIKAERDEAVRTKAHVAKGREGTLMSNDEIAKAQQAGMFAGLKMSSREIADRTGKKYFHVKRDIEVLMNQGAICASNVGFTSFQVPMPRGGYRTDQEYMLDFKATMVLTTGYDSVRRAAVIDRWMELEEIVAVKPAEPKFTIPQTMAEALRLAADLSEENQMLVNKIEEDAPKVSYADAVDNAEGYLTLTATAKMFKLSPQKFIKFLKDTNRLYKNGDKNLPLQSHIDNGTFKVLAVPYGYGGNKLTTQTVVTGKGQQVLFKHVNKQRARGAFLHYLTQTIKE